MRQTIDDPPPVRLFSFQTLIALLLALATSLMVWRFAWVSEDSFITLRYVSNALAGHGAVFNVGEFVQGYTHPLWFLLLLAGGVLVPDLIYLATAMGLLLTALTQILIARTLFRLGGASPHGLIMTAVFASLCVMSNSWLSFQTGGLENALSHLILVALVSEVVQYERTRPHILTGLGAMLILSRPDFGFLFLPIALTLLPKLRERTVLIQTFLGALPLLCWLSFALYYYGDLAPNTAYAKVGIFPTWRDGAAQGWLYLLDFIEAEPIAAFASLLLLLFATLRADSVGRGALAAGIWLQLLYVIAIGGDFMRGRFLLAIYVASLVFGLCRLTESLRDRRAPPWWSGAILMLAGLGLAVASPLDGEREPSGREAGIGDERLYYPGYHISAYRKHGRLKNPYRDLAIADRLRKYAEVCGPVTIHARNPGTLGYLAGPDVSVIDTLGLTDAFIAHLPKERLLAQESRVGHPDKRIPLSYLARRGDISFIEGWREAVSMQSCDFKRLPDAYLDSEEDFVRHHFFPQRPESP